MAERLSALGARATRTIPVPILDLEGFLHLPETDRPPRVLFVGRLAPEKNLPLWLDAARRIAAAVPEARFDIVGGGAARASLEGLTRDLDLAHTVTFHGPKPRSALRELYAQSAILMLSSDHEGFGRVLVEALASGAAVVSTATAGAKEIVENEATGLLAPVGDAAGLAAAAIRLLHDKSLRHTLAMAGRRRMSERYRPNALAGAWVDMLIDAAGRRAPRSTS
jgi:glycosyltransferase involved in cell wall biosynthesis